MGSPERRLIERMLDTSEQSGVPGKGTAHVLPQLAYDWFAVNLVIRLGCLRLYHAIVMYTNGWYKHTGA